MATAVSVPDTRAAATRAAYSTATLGAAKLTAPVSRNTPISTASSFFREMPPQAAVITGVPTA